jgi:L-ribulose-5-phosphate 4-epimerase
MLEALRAEVLEANLELVRRDLVLYTFGNVGGIARRRPGESTSERVWSPGL